MPAESAVKHILVLAAPFRQDVVAERVRDLGAEYSFLLEQTESISLQDLGPFVGIITRAVTTREYVAEGGRDAGLGD